MQSTTAGSKEARQLEKVKKAFEDAYRKTKAKTNTAQDGGVKYAIQNNIVDTNGNVYNKVVKPGLTIYNKVKHNNKDYIHYLEDHIYPRTFSVPALDGTTIKVEFAKDSDRIQKDEDKSPRKVRGELSSADTKLKKIAILNIRDLIKNSEPLAHKGQNKHQWLDANGWSDRKAYMRYGDEIYPVIIHIANAHDGRHILYDVSVLTNEGSTVDIGATALASLSDDGTSSSRGNESKLAVKSIEPSGEMLPQEQPGVKGKLSPDSDPAQDAENMMNQIAPDSYSLSNEGEAPKLYGDLHISGKDVAIDFGPVREDLVTSQTDSTLEGVPIGENTKPAQQSRDTNTHISLEDYANSESPV